jgi:alpha-beta hydrolase superfamily lysophospholipase
VAATTTAATGAARANAGCRPAAGLLADLAQVIDPCAAPAGMCCWATAWAAWWRRVSWPRPLQAAPAPWSRPVDGLVLSSPALDAGLGPAQKLLLAVLGPLAPDLRVNNGLKSEWVSRDPELVRRYDADPLVHDRITPRLVRFIVDSGAFVRPGAVLARAHLAAVGGCRPLRGPRRQRGLRGGGAAGGADCARIPGLYHELFNEPERAEVLGHLTRWLALRAAGATNWRHHERTFTPC